jgi:hypothetical protein
VFLEGDMIGASIWQKGLKPLSSSDAHCNVHYSIPLAGADDVCEDALLINKHQILIKLMNSFFLSCLIDLAEVS